MLATILKERRLALHLTQQAVANQLHTTRQTISNWENGKNYPDVPMLVAISNLYGLSLDDMLKKDTQYLNKVANDYQLINRQKRGHLLDYVLLLTLSGLIMIALGPIFFKAQFNEQLTGFFVLIFTTVLVILSYFKTAQFYPKQPGTKQPFLIPKVVGIGLTINPNHPAGKIIWIVILLFVLGSLLTVIF
ncbi:XRE family transcriptional regulator [Latilactobacillus sakei]|nr:helix-turn-helix transcriptional regulator [Latilactobacillus sakei]AUX10957.1 XRE family transcriptional regulator [Latilactobacillus sakei]